MTDKKKSNDTPDIDITKIRSKTREEQERDGLEQIREQTTKALNIKSNTKLEEAGNFGKLRDFKHYFEFYSKIIGQGRSSLSPDSSSLSSIINIMNLHAEQLRVHFIGSLRIAGAKLKDDSNWKSIEKEFQEIKRYLISQDSDLDGSEALENTKSVMLKILHLPQETFDMVEENIKLLIEFEENCTITDSE